MRSRLFGLAMIRLPLHLFKTKPFLYQGKAERSRRGVPVVLHLCRLLVGHPPGTEGRPADQGKEARHELQREGRRGNAQIEPKGQRKYPYMVVG